MGRGLNILPVGPFLEALFENLRAGSSEGAQINPVVLGKGLHIQRLAENLQGSQAVLFALLVSEFFEFFLLVLEHQALVGNDPAQVVAEGKDLIRNTVVIVLAHLQGVFQGLFDLKIKPVFDGGGDELHRDKKKYDGGQKRKSHEREDEFRSEFRPHDVLFSFKKQLYQVSHREKEQEKQQYDVDIDEDKYEDIL